MITKRWNDPCPECGGEVQDIGIDFEHVVDNPESVLSLPNPGCQYDGDDPDSPDCICTAMVNPAPNPMLDTYITIGATVTMQPCGDVLRVPAAGGKLGGKMAGWKMYQQDIPEPGSLGELMQDWVAVAEDLP